MKRRKASQRRKVTYGLLVLAVVMLLASAVGSTRAALTYYSENYTAEITVSQIGVSLLENGETVSSRDYNKNKWNETGNNGSASAVLLKNMLKKDEKLALNKKYDEKRNERRVYESKDLQVLGKPGRLKGDGAVAGPYRPSSCKSGKLGEEPEEHERVYGAFL